MSKTTEKSKETPLSVELRDKYAEGDELELSDLKTATSPRPGFKRYYARESEVRMRQAEGYEIVTNHDNKISLYATRSQDPTNNTTVYRIPTQDSQEDLILMEIPLELYEKKEAREQRIVNERDAQLHPKKYSTSGGTWTQSNETEIIK